MPSRSLCLFFVLILSGLLVVVIVRTLTVGHLEDALVPCGRETENDSYIEADEAVIRRFQEALRLQTVCWGRGNYNRVALENIGNLIKQSYPVIHSTEFVSWEKVANFSFLYHVMGKNLTLLPYLLMAHLDVVPADSTDWDHPPFEGQILDGYIYGRGTLDDKHNVFGIMEALEFALKRGYRPLRSFYIAFGHDEECSGMDGARSIAKQLKQSNVELEFILDEGLVVMDGFLSSFNRPVALVGTSEKGFLTVRLSVNVGGGHSSMPARESSIGILANAVARLESNQHPSMLGRGPEFGLLTNLAPHVGCPGLYSATSGFSDQFFHGMLKWEIAHISCCQDISFKPILSMKPDTNAFIRTTTAVTMFKAGIKDNVIAPYAEATVNHRIHPSQTVDEVLQFDKNIINDDRVGMETLASMEPHPQSDHSATCTGFQIIRSTIQQLWHSENVVILPATLIANTDTIHYLSLAKNIYRFSNVLLRPEDLKRVHGVNERISIESYERLINFYFHLFQNADTVATRSQHSPHDDF